MLHKGLFTDSEEFAFHLATFVLRGAWANRHQSELTHGLASAQGTRGHEKNLLELRRVCLEHGIAMSVQRGVMGPK
jgi:hypothetical protein